MGMRDILSRPTKPVVGERYTVTGIVLGEADDRFNPGAKRPTLILKTDKGDIYATNQMSQEAANDPDDAVNVLIGATVVAYEYHSKAANRDCVGLKLEN